MNKVSIIGSGNIGSVLCLLCVQKEIGEIVLIDKGTKANGIALDILESTHVHKNDIRITGTTDYSNIKDSDIIVITAGIARKPGMDRIDLLQINNTIMLEIGSNIKKYAPNSTVLVVSNPVDLMVYTIFKSSGLPKHKVIGMAGILDSARFGYFISKELNISIKDISTLVLGGHGDNMIPLKEYTKINGISISHFLSENKINELIQRTRVGGGEIVNLLKTGSAYFAPAYSVFSMLESILNNQNRLVSVSCYLEGEYNQSGIYIGVPAILSKNGIKKIIEIPLNKDEQIEFNKTSEKYKQNIKELNNL